MLKYIKKLLRKAFKRFMGNCKSMIEVLKDDRSSNARELSTAISNLTKSIGRAMIMVRHLDADGLRNVVFDIESQVKDINNSDYSELRLHNKDFDRCFGTMISSSEVFVNMINKYSDAISGSKFSITRHDSMPWCRRKRHCDSTTQAIMFAFSLVIKLLKASVKGVFALIKNIKAYGYSKEIERKIRSGELSERVLISRCKEVAIQYLKHKLTDADNDIDRDLIKDSISRIRSARTFEDFSFIRNEPIYGQFEMLFMAYRKAVKRLEKEIDLSRTITRDCMPTHHCDSISDSIQKLKNKVKNAVDKFNSYSTTKKIAIILASTLPIIGGIAVAIKVKDLKKADELDKEISNSFDEAFKEYNKDFEKRTNEWYEDLKKTNEDVQKQINIITNIQKEAEKSIALNERNKRTSEIVDNLTGKLYEDIKHYQFEYNRNANNNERIYNINALLKKSIQSKSREAKRAGCLNLFNYTFKEKVNNLVKKSDPLYNVIMNSIVKY